MAERSWFFDSVDGDRISDMQQMARSMEMLATDGVVAGHGDELQVVQTAPVSDRVRILLGRLWVEGRPYEVYGTPKETAVIVADPTHPRIDRVVVRRDLAAREAVHEYLVGVAAAEPVPAALTQDAAGVWHQPLAKVHVPANATQFYTDEGSAPAGQGWVEDEREFARGLSVVATVELNVQAASYTLALDDAGRCVEMIVATANNLTVPPHADVAFPVGTIILVRQAGAGQTTVTAGAGVTVRQRENKFKLGGQWAEASLHKRAADEWALVGDLSA